MPDADSVFDAESEASADLEFDADFDMKFENTDFDDLIESDEFEEDTATDASLLTDINQLPALRSGDRTVAILSIAEAFRNEYPDPFWMDTLLLSELEPWERTDLLNAVLIAVARFELLMGWVHIGGVQAGGRNAWEHNGSNRGDFPSYYQNTVLTPKRATGSRWCTSFAGAIACQLHFGFNPSILRNQSRSIWWSGFRLRKFANTGLTRLGEVASHLPGPLTFDTGSAHLDIHDWRQLASALDTADDRLNTMQLFFDEHGWPRQGDVLLFPRHTMLVESMDSTTGLLRTIEGNTGHAVRSRRLDLTNPRTIRGGNKPKKLCITGAIRIGSDYYISPSVHNQRTTRDEGIHAAGELLNTIRDLTSQLCQVAFDLELIASSDALAHAEDWLGTAGTDASLT